MGVLHQFSSLFLLVRAFHPFTFSVIKDKYILIVALLIFFGLLFRIFFLPFLSLLSCLFFFFSRAAPAAYGGSQARGLIGAVAAGLHQSHSNVGSELHLRPTLQLTAMLDPYPTDQGQGLNLPPPGS